MKTLFDEENKFNLNDDENPQFQTLKEGYPDWADNPREDLRTCPHFPSDFYNHFQTDYEFDGYKFIGQYHGKGHKAKTFLV